MLKEKTAIITGASRGIGKAIAEIFAENNAFVGINYYKSQLFAEETFKKIKEKDGKAILLKGDVSNPKEVESFIKKFVSKSKHIDILVNNAGIYERSNFEKISHKTWNNVISTNLSGCFNVCKQAIPYMKPGGKIIFISSQLAYRGSSHGADYASSKAGMLGLMRSLALELACKKINVNAVAPGTIDTDIIANYSEEVRKQRKKEIPLNRLGTPKDIANTCLFLASNLSDYITGETINVNGGLYIH
ncbi:MAG: 3-oxoacyl-ACP reductase FabG [Thermoplasmatales archaeon]|nr:MAG: 3-oxoacyl-ACP reductase FabG [Thermoplasmatales archaeon]